jgi:hypothetical protein
MNQVNLFQTPQPALGFAPRQTNAEANYHQAMAHANADPRFNAKQYDRPGSSRGKGQYAFAASRGAADYAENMARGEAARMGDAYSNANLSLGEQARRQDFGMALAGLQEQQSQNAAMQQLGRQSRAMDFTGNVFNQMTGLAGGMMGGSPQAAFGNFGGGLLKGLM